MNKVPPKTEAFSITKTLRLRCAAKMAAGSPAVPPPIIITSQFSLAKAA